MPIRSITEKEFENKVSKYLHEIGCTIVRSEVDVNMRERRGRADLVGYIIDENGKSVPKIVVEISSKPNPSIQQRLYEYAKALDCPYGLLVINEKKYWFDGETSLPWIFEPPTFESKSRYIEDVTEIKNQLDRSLWSLLDGSGRLISIPKGIGFLASGLLIRAYLDHSEEQDIAYWFQIRTEQEYKQLLDQSLSYFGMEGGLSIGEFPISIEQWIKLLTEIPPIRKSLGEATLSLIHDVLAREGKNGEYVSPQHIRKAFKDIIAGLNVDGERAIDLAAGYSSVSFDIYANNFLNVDYFRGYEIVSEVCGIAQVISIISDFKHLKYVCADALLLDGDKHNEKYSLVVVDPPLGGKGRDNVEYDKFELTRRSRNARTSDLMIEQALNLAEPSGYIVTLVPEGTLFSSGPSSFIRDLMKERAIVEGIISLPSHTMKPFTGVKVSILVLRKKKEVTETAEEVFLGNPKSVDDIHNVIEEFHNWRWKEDE
jgi:hypothetical protein